MKGAEPEKHCSQKLIHCGTIKLFASSNATTQDNSVGLIEKNSIHMQRKNYRSGNTEEKQLLEHMGLMRTSFGMETLNDHPSATINNMEIGPDR